MEQLLPVVCGACMVLALFFAMDVIFKKKPKFMESMKEKHVFITGGSSGIGLAIAKEAVLQGGFVTLVSRSSTNLSKAVDELVQETGCKRERVNCQAADVGDHKAISGAVRAAVQWRPIDVMICNAGIVRGGYLEDMSVADMDEVIRTNLTGVVYGLKEALPSLKEHSLAGHPVSILIVASLASLFYMYGHTVYTATKYAMRGLAEGLRAELYPYDNMQVTLLCPGFVDTPFLEEVSEQGEIVEIMKKINFLNKKGSETPVHTAKCALEAVKEGRFLAVTRIFGVHLMALGRGLIPADSPRRAALELALLVPFRLLSHAVSRDVRRIVRRFARTRH